MYSAYNVGVLCMYAGINSSAEINLGISATSFVSAVGITSALAVSLTLIPYSIPSINITITVKMSASTRIPPIAQPFVSDRAKKTLDLVHPIKPLLH